MCRQHWEAEAAKSNRTFNLSKWVGEVDEGCLRRARGKYDALFGPVSLPSKSSLFDRKPVSPARGKRAPAQTFAAAPAPAPVAAPAPVLPPPVPAPVWGQRKRKASKDAEDEAAAKLAKVKCYKCGQHGHYHNKCPNKR